MSEPVENGAGSKINPKTGHPIGKRFGIEKPAIPGPGRPRLTPEERAERQILKDASPEAADRLRAAIKSHNEKNAIRACEIILSKTVPDLTEGVIHDERPLHDIPDEQLERKLADLRSRRGGDSAGTGAAA